jgi:acyl-CoA reductase-like NAD-dependent aldehyde dehydrogenase
MNELTQESLAQAIAALRPRTQIFINGTFVDAQSGETFATISPRDGSELAQVASGDSVDVDAAVQAARSAFEDGRWSNLKPIQRKRTMLRFAELVRAHRLELALLETLDMGKPISDAFNVDLESTANCIQFYAECADKVYGQIAPTGPNVVGMITREPVGVVGAIVPWNYPLLMAAWKLGPALITGNSVVLKPAEQSPLSTLRLAELAAEAGIPDGVLNVVPGFGEKAGAAIGMHMDVDAVSFTGSVAVGKLFLQYAAKSNMKQVSLECGGKTPHIVMEDVEDLDVAAKNVALGIFFNQGEVCNAGSRLLVEASIKDEVLDRVAYHSRSLQPGDPIDLKSTMGAMVDESQMNKVLEYVQRGQQEGANVRMGGKRVLKDTGGFYIEPTIFDGVRSEMAIAQEEIFGPVLSTISFTGADEAVRIGNDSIFGLAAAVWTSNLSTAHRMAKQLRAGTVWINCFDSSDMTVPFGGYKQSGHGRDKSLHAMDKYTQLKTTWIELAE